MINLIRIRTIAKVDYFFISNSLKDKEKGDAPEEEAPVAWGEEGGGDLGNGVDEGEDAEEIRNRRVRSRDEDLDEADARAWSWAEEEDATRLHIFAASESQTETICYSLTLSRCQFLCECRCESERARILAPFFFFCWHFLLYWVGSTTFVSGESF